MKRKILSSFALVFAFTVFCAGNLFSQQWVRIKGDVTFEGQDLCAFVLANGQYMFSCDADMGNYDLTVPPDQNGNITLFGFCDGLAPFRKTISKNAADLLNQDISFSAAPENSPEMEMTRNLSHSAEKPGWVDITGTVTYAGTPLNMMVLANGQYMFTDPADGKYSLTVPLDPEGKITLFGFSDGLMPYRITCDGNNFTCDTGDYVEEPPLVKTINDYRQARGLPRVPYSPSLQTVAETHARDLHDNRPDKADECNTHSWSDDGSWTPCCYTPDHDEAECMWYKPQELTSYPGVGFEVTVYSTADLDDLNEIMQTWENSTPHLNVIMNRDIWADYTWNAIGAAIYREYACAWFGREEDPAAE